VRKGKSGKLKKDSNNISSKEEVLEKIRKSQERLIVSLAATWETASDDLELREQLMEASEKAVNLREKVYKQILEEEPPDVSESYEKLRSKLEEEIKERN
jgi:hypothetical protein